MQNRSLEYWYPWVGLCIPINPIVCNRRSSYYRDHFCFLVAILLAHPHHRCFSLKALNYLSARDRLGCEKPCFQTLSQSRHNGWSLVVFHQISPNIWNRITCFNWSRHFWLKNLACLVVLKSYYCLFRPSCTASPITVTSLCRRCLPHPTACSAPLHLLHSFCVSSDSQCNYIVSLKSW